MSGSETLRWFGRLATAVLIGLLFLPVVRNVDGLPLSTYPMFASARSSEVRFVAASGVNESGERFALPIRQIADTFDPLIAQAFLNNALERGDIDRACTDIAARVDETFVAVEIATEVHNVVNNTRGAESLLGRSLHSRCEVPP